MKRAIKKYQIRPETAGIEGEIAVGMPMGAEVLTVREMATEIYVWARVDPEETRTIKRMFWLCDDDRNAPFADYLGTAFMWTGPKHVFVTNAGTRSVPR